MSQIKGNIVHELMDSLRNTSLGSETASEISSTMLVWAKLSEAASIPQETRIDARFIAEPKLALEALKKLGKENNADLQALSKELSALNTAMLQPILDLAHRAMVSGVLQDFGAMDVLATEILWGTQRREYVPPTVARLMTGLAQVGSKDAAYIGWDLGGVTTYMASLSAGSVYLETRSNDLVLSLINLLIDNPFEVHIADPIRNPSAIEAGKPRKFDVAISIPPFGQRYEATFAQRDWFGRFPEPTTSGSVLAIRQGLSHASRRLVIAVPNSILFSAGSELALRKDLVRRGMVEAVVAIPSGQMPGTNISFAILVLDPSGGHENIRFVSADVPPFSGSSSSTREEWQSDIRDLVNICFRTDSTDKAVTVARSEVFLNDSQLQVNRYLLSNEKKRLRELLAQSRSIELNRVCTTVRSMPTTSDEQDSIAAMEVAAADIPLAGYIGRPSRAVRIAEEDAGKNPMLFLRPFDIVLIVKGSVGKIGIVPADVPDPGPGGWVAGQSAVVLRSTDPDLIDPRALAVQLRSPIGQELLKGIVSGASIPIIQQRELMQLKVINPDAETSRQAIDALDQESRLQQEIEALREKQLTITQSLWRLN